MDTVEATARPPCELDEIQAWIEFALDGEIKGRQTGSYPTFNSYTYVEIPEWSMRQKLDAVKIAVAERDSTQAAIKRLRALAERVASSACLNQIECDLTARPDTICEPCHARAALAEEGHRKEIA